MRNTIYNLYASIDFEEVIAELCITFAFESKAVVNIEIGGVFFAVQQG